MKVYILNTYDEHGPEYIHATIKPQIMFRVLTEQFFKDLKTVTNDKWLQELYKDQKIALEKMNELISKNELCSENLNAGWGGYQLHIVELE